MCTSSLSAANPPSLSLGLAVASMDVSTYDALNMFDEMCTRFTLFFSFFLSDLLADFAQPQLCFAYSSSEFSIDIETSSIGSVQLMRHNVLVLDIHFFTN